MPRTAPNVVSWLLAAPLAVACVACAGRTPEPPDNPLDAEPMGVAEAREIVAEVRRDNGFGEAADVRGPTSIADVREIVRTDQLHRFDRAREYAARLTGVDALALRASLEALWADALLTVADLYHEMSRRTLADMRTLEATRETMDPQAADRLIAERKQKLEKVNRIDEALRVLARPHLEATGELAREAQRQSPKAVAGYVPGAHASLLQRDWSDFDRQLRKAEELAPERTVYMRYLRGLERAMRFADREGAQQRLEAVVAEAPEVSRARARLILLDDTPTGRHEQLEQLKRHSPQHPIVLLAGPIIEREYVVSQELSSAAAAADDAPPPIEEAEPADDDPAETAPAGGTPLVPEPDPTQDDASIE